MSNLSSLISGSECSTSANPLSQLSKAGGGRGGLEDQFQSRSNALRPNGVRHQGPRQGEATHGDELHFAQQESHFQSHMPMSFQQPNQSSHWADAFMSQNLGHSSGQHIQQNRGYLSQNRAGTTQEPAQAPQTSSQGWSSEFMKHTVLPQTPNGATLNAGLVNTGHSNAGIEVYSHPNAMEGYSGGMGYAPMFPQQPMMMHAPAQGQQSQSQQPQQDSTENVQWDTLFNAQREQLKEIMDIESEKLSRELEQLNIASDAFQDMAIEQEGEQKSEEFTGDKDELARTAQNIINRVEEIEKLRSNKSEPVSGSGELNSKLANSSFMQLMRKIRDHEVSIEGDKMVENIAPSISAERNGMLTGNTGLSGVSNTGLSEMGGVGNLGVSGVSGPTFNQTSSSPSTGNMEKQTTGYTDSTQLRQEEGRINEGFTVPQTFNDAVAYSNGAFGLHPEATVREGWQNQSAYNHHHDAAEIEALFSDEDAVRAMREEERAQQNAPVNKFQGDGGAIDDDMELFLEHDGSRILRASTADDTVGALSAEYWEDDALAGEIAASLEKREDSETESFRERFDPRMVVGNPLHLNEPRARVAPGEDLQQEEWNTLEREMDELDRVLAEERAAVSVEADATSAQERATSTQNASMHGVSSTHSTAAQASTATASVNTQSSQYLFDPGNTSDMATHHHAMHGGHAVDPVLELEAQLEQEPTNAFLWYSLGLKQQENEHEVKAIAALKKALEADSSFGEAYLALAVSYTNENNRAQAHQAIDDWLGVRAETSHAEGREALEAGREDAEEKLAYWRTIGTYRDMFGPLPTDEAKAHTYLTQLLIRLAQEKAQSDGQFVDADVQIALGVLFNSSDEFEKAGDCFNSALSVLPENPLLYNRVGATLANGGKPAEAVPYYNAALELSPGYVRARLNLAVAKMNLGAHEEAVDDLLSALHLQESGKNAPGATGSATSQSLWDSLNIAFVMLHRSDLAVMTGRHELEAITSEWQSRSM